MTLPAETFVLLSIDGDEAALRRADVAEILPLARLERPGGAPRALAGFMNLGGRPLPVLRLGVLLGSAEPADAGVYSHVVRLRGEVGLLVDRVLDAAAKAEATAPVAPDESLNGCVAERLTVGGRFIPRLDAERLLLAEEAARLAEMTRTMAERLAEWSAA